METKKKKSGWEQQEEEEETQAGTRKRNHNSTTTAILFFPLPLFHFEGFLNLPVFPYMTAALTKRPPLFEPGPGSMIHFHRTQFTPYQITASASRHAARVFLSSKANGGKNSKMRGPSGPHGIKNSASQLLVLDEEDEEEKEEGRDMRDS